MHIPKEIAEKVQTYQAGSEQARKARESVLQWLNSNTVAGGVYVGDLYLVDVAAGFPQNDGEYCLFLSSAEFYESGFLGVYYHPIENSTKYLAYRYSC